jgi:hypothetical protein
MQAIAAQAGGVIRVPPARSYNAGRAGLVDGVVYATCRDCVVGYSGRRGIGGRRGLVGIVGLCSKLSLSVLALPRARALSLSLSFSGATLSLLCLSAGAPGPHVSV